jgi:type II secretory pathway component PulC
VSCYRAPTMSLSNGSQAGKQASQEAKNCRLVAIEKAGGTFPKIARELCGIAFSDIADFVTVAEGGEVQAIPSNEIPKRKRKAIKKIREKRRILNTPGDKGDVVLDQSTEYELYDKMDALKYLCRLRGDEVQKIDLGIQGIEDILRKLDGKNE